VKSAPPIIEGPTSSVSCSLCGSPTPETEAAESCPFRDDPECVTRSASGAPASASLALDETRAYQPPRDDLDAAFRVEDLVHSRLGQYRIVEEIGRGTMARVFKGFHVGLGRISALKVLSPGLVSRQPRVVDWFLGEARAVAGLIHPHIVTIHNLGFDRGYHFVEMEYVRGGRSLNQAVAADGPFAAIQATTLVRQVATALDAAHEAGLIHRDVKPANILQTPEGLAKLADFGLVRRIDEAEVIGGSLAGTPTFMAPELFSGEEPTPRSDLYALGVTLFYLLTARMPFQATKLSRLIQLHRTTPPPNPRLIVPEIPDELSALVLRLLSKDPRGRPASAQSLIEDLDQIVGHLRDTETLVREGVEGLPCLIQQGARDQFRIIVPVPGDRLHEVYVEVTEGRKRERLLTVYSVCAPADPRHYQFALRINAELTYGALSIREVNGAPMFVMTRTYPRGQVTPADIRAAVQEIARRGDWVEQQLTCTDLY
jgi:serine/threonine-protein kinase